MSYELPPSIAAYFQATNDRNTQAFLAAFAPDAVVHDEGNDYKGTDEIARWRDETTAKYQTHFEIIDANESEGETVVTAKVSGTFDGSPIELDFHFTLRDDRIAALNIP